MSRHCEKNSNNEIFEFINFPDEFYIRLLVEVQHEELKSWLLVSKKLRSLINDYPTSERIYRERLFKLINLNKIYPYLSSILSVSALTPKLSHTSNKTWKQYYFQMQKFVYWQSILEPIKFCNLLAIQNQLFELQIMSKMNNLYYPSLDSISTVCVLGHTAIIQWLIDEKQVLLNSCADMAAMGDNLELLQLLYTQQIIVTKNGVRHAIVGKRLNILQWLYEMRIEIEYTREDYKLAQCPTIKKFINYVMKQNSEY